MPSSATDTPVVLSASLNDRAIPGVMIVVAPDVADHMGAFREEALSEADAWMANGDMSGAD